MNAALYKSLRTMLAVALGAGFGSVVERNFDTPKQAVPAKVIDWRPADRYEMIVSEGAVWRLDRATGAIHIVTGNLSFDIPEYRTE